MPEFIAEGAPFKVRDQQIASRTDAHLVAHELNRHIVATKKLLGVAPRQTT